MRTKGKESKLNYLDTTRLRFSQEFPRDAHQNNEERLDETVISPTPFKTYLCLDITILLTLLRHHFLVFVIQIKIFSLYFKAVL